MAKFFNKLTLILSILIINPNIISMQSQQSQDFNKEELKKISAFLHENFSFQERIYVAIQHRYTHWLRENIHSYPNKIKAKLLNNQSPWEFALKHENKEALAILTIYINKD